MNSAGVPIIPDLDPTNPVGRWPDLAEEEEVVDEGDEIQEEFPRPDEKKVEGEEVDDGEMWEEPVEQKVEEEVVDEGEMWWEDSDDETMEEDDDEIWEDFPRKTWDPALQPSRGLLKKRPVKGKKEDSAIAIVQEESGGQEPQPRRGIRFEFTEWQEERMREDRISTFVKPRPKPRNRTKRPVIVFTPVNDPDPNWGEDDDDLDPPHEKNSKTEPGPWVEPNYFAGLEKYFPDDEEWKKELAEYKAKMAEVRARAEFWREMDIRVREEAAIFESNLPPKEIEITRYPGWDIKDLDDLPDLRSERWPNNTRWDEEWETVKCSKDWEWNYEHEEFEPEFDRFLDGLREEKVKLRDVVQLAERAALEKNGGKRTMKPRQPDNGSVMAELLARLEGLTPMMTQ